MTFFQAFFLAIIQGLTEFLPVSSSGHLVIFQKIFGLEAPILFDVLVHVGTLGAAFFFFKKRLIEIGVGLMKREKKARELFWFLVIGSLPAALAGLFLQGQVECIFDSLKLVGISLLVTAIFLFSTRKIRGVRKEFGVLDKKGAFWIGLFQALSILPGISRSGATISAGLFRGLEQEEAFEFSFLLAIPAIIGALVLQIPALFGLPANYLVQGFLGMVVAGVAGFFCLKILKRTLLSERFFLFGFYCFFLGLVVLVV